jgi:hypothetical protein
MAAETNDVLESKAKTAGARRSRRFSARTEQGVPFAFDAAGNLSGEAA